MNSRSIRSSANDVSVRSDGYVESDRSSHASIKGNTGNTPQSIFRRGHLLLAIGNVDLLSLSKIGLLCSRQCPAATILEACKQFKQWAADPNATIISGFHSPVEQECLHLLLKGKANIIHCPAREIETMRLAKEWKLALAADRMLIVSPFAARRATRKNIYQRNQLVADLADDLYIPYRRTRRQS